ncbi:general secretion pathway protein GspK [Zavarzinia aquatilis]|uniref:T2SS protein K first SAM-like domain-containing protein n=1 Tax=Zavarzinia aquatilis TaxID=2211142 RepID=A0A317EE80_9PROT|nr:type II secretion system protein GspK [Zavarzinia aquatilis]PWR25358.1 hypothetical protein DKG74_06245 [Zavarzinia aquatilis]
MGRDPGRRYPGRRGERGVALLIVVGALAVMVVLAAGVIAAVRQQAHVARRDLAGVSADAALEGAVWRVAGRLIAAGSGAGSGLGAGAEGGVLPEMSPAGIDLMVGEVAVHVRVRPEAAKLDLNRADEVQLAALLRAAGLGDGEAQGVAAAIADWRDADGFLRNGGAEADAYAARGLAGLPPNRPFEDVLEVRNVLGLPPAVADCILPDLTLFNPSGPLVPAGASPLIRRALGLAPEAGAAPPVEAPMPGDVVALEARIAGEAGVDRYSRRWILRITGNMAEPVQVLERRDLGPLEAAAEAACPPGLGPAAR